MNEMGLFIWIAIVVLVAIFCIVIYKVFVKDWYSHRSSEVKWGLLSCFFTIAFFLFAPLLTMGKSVDRIVEKINEILHAGNDSLSFLGVGNVDEESISQISRQLGMSIRAFLHIPNLSSPKNQIMIALAGILIIVGIIAYMIYLVKERKKEFIVVDERKHLFEIQESAYKELTKKRS